MYTFSSHFGSLFCSFIKRGNKVRAILFIHRVLIQLKLRTGHDPFFVFDMAFLNVRPSLGLRALKLGGLIYRVPVLISETKRLILTVRFFMRSLAIMRTSSSHLRFLKSVGLNNSQLIVFVNLIYESFLKSGEGVRMKNALHFLAVRNRAFVRFLK